MFKIKDVDYRCILWNMTCIYIINPNKKPVEIIKEVAFGGTYFKHISSGVNEKQYRDSWKEFIELKNIDQKLSENSDLSKNH